MLPFGLADVLSSTLDFTSFYNTVVITAREMLKNLLFNGMSMLHMQLNTGKF